MATPKKGPSFYGPTGGWTASSLTPVTTTTSAVAAAPVSKFQKALNSTGFAPRAMSSANLNQYDLTAQELGGGGASGGRGGGGTSRGTFTTPTPLEALLASIFPDAATGSDPAPLNPNTAAPQQGALFRTILGNLGADGFGGGAGAAPAPVYIGPSFGGPSGAGAQIAATIPGAPAFLGGAIDRVNAGGSYMYAPPVVAGGGGAGGLNAAGIAALAAEQRMQANQLAQETAAANAAYFEQQQANKRAQAMTEQRRRQRFGAPNTGNSGWATNPILF